MYYYSKWSRRVRLSLLCCELLSRWAFPSPFLKTLMAAKKKKKKKCKKDGRIYSSSSSFLALQTKKKNNIHHAFTLQ
jgi:hypothetical protein